MLGNVSASGVIGGASSGASIGAMAGGPLGAGIGAAAGAVASLISGLWTNVNDQAATTCANNAEYAGQANLAEWNNYAPNLKTTTLQTTYLNNALQIWSYLQSCCGQPQLGSAGQRCVSERARGGKYDFLAANYDPIKNDPEVYDPSSVITPIITATGVVSPTSVATGSSGSVVSTVINDVESSPDLLYIGAGLLVALLIL